MMPAEAVQPAMNSAPVQRALFTLSKPIQLLIDDRECEVHGIDMRALDISDLGLLDQYQGQPIALIQNVVARLCDITIEQVQQLDVEDFAMLADDAIWQLAEACKAIGLPLNLFAHPLPDEQADTLLPESGGMRPQSLTS